jgi:hypothetical protein
MFPELQYREYYRHLADDELARIALESELVPEARQALTEELRNRGMTDLSEYKKALHQAAIDRSPGRQMQIQAQMQQQIHEWTFVVLAWFCSMLAPLCVLGPASRQSVQGSAITFAVLAAFIGFSCYLGIRARCQGSRIGYRLKSVIPLALLGISTIAVVVLNPH